MVDTELDAVTVNLKLLLMSNVNGIEGLRLKVRASLTKSQRLSLLGAGLTAHRSSYVRRTLFPFIPSD
jgi:hypothetical protein